MGGLDVPHVVIPKTTICNYNAAANRISVYLRRRRRFFNVIFSLIFEITIVEGRLSRDKSSDFTTKE